MNIKTNYIMKKFQALNWMQIAGLLRSESHRTDFEKNSTWGEKFEQMETASYAININIDVDLAYESIKRGYDLSDCLSKSHVEFCCG